MKGEMNLPSRVRASRQKAGSFLMSFYVGCHQNVVPRVRLGLLASHNLVKKNQLQLAYVLVDSRYSQVDN